MQERVGDGAARALTREFSDSAGDENADPVPGEARSRLLALQREVLAWAANDGLISGAEVLALRDEVARMREGVVASGQGR